MLGLRPVGLRGEPAFELQAREQPLPAELGGRQAVRAGKVVERAFGQAQIRRRLAQGQDIRHRMAENGICCGSVKVHRRLTRRAAIHSLHAVQETP